MSESAIPSDAVLNAALRSAFEALPPQTQDVLRYTAIQKLSPDAAAPLLGMEPAAVARYTAVARDALRAQWILALQRSLPEHSECRWTIGQFGADAFAPDDSRSVGHLAGCDLCLTVAERADDVAGGLAAALLTPATVIAPVQGAPNEEADMLAFVQSFTEEDGAASARTAVAPTVAAGAASTVDASAAPLAGALVNGERDPAAQSAGRRRRATIVIAAVVAVAVFGGASAAAMAMMAGPGSDGSPVEPISGDGPGADQPAPAAPAESSSSPEPSDPLTTDSSDADPQPTPSVGAKAPLDAGPVPTPVRTKPTGGPGWQSATPTPSTKPTHPVPTRSPEPTTPPKPTPTPTTPDPEPSDPSPTPPPGG